MQILKRETPILLLLYAMLLLCMGIDGFDRNKTSLTGAIFLSQSQNAAYRTPQCSQSLENNATESLSLNSAPSRSQYGGRLFPLATLHLQNHCSNLNKHLETSFK